MSHTVLVCVPIFSSVPTQMYYFGEMDIDLQAVLHKTITTTTIVNIISLYSESQIWRLEGLVFWNVEFLQDNLQLIT